ncbi:MAG TPA: DEAD/DEAH box helicase, partial [Baekduia sp.]|nr:DEAD/DEAH box helicase [Baekduia sp.]
MPVLPPPEDAVLLGPFWPTPVRVIKAAVTGDSVRVQAVSITNGEYFDRLLTRDQYEADVQELVAGIHTFDASPRLFRLATAALRTHLAHVFDPQFAVSVSQVDPLPHQIEAVYRRILPLPRIRFLLADDPGAGKTIMAGLLMRELMQRQDVRRVLVLCPKALTDQWRREMWERFKQRFVLVTGETVSTAFGQNAWMDNNLVVASVDLGVQPHIEPGLEQAEWDLVIFDEAHKLSAYRYGSKIEKTQRYQLAEKLAQKTRHLLLMTKKTHKGDPENFRLLLSLLDPDVFASAAGAEAAIDPDASPYFLRRMKETMRDWYGRPLFLPRHVTTPPYDLNEHESDLYQAVTDYVQRGIRLADESAEGQVRRNVGLALTILQRRLTSSLYAVTRSLERRRDRLSDELDTLRKSGRTPVGLGSDTIDYDEEEDDSDKGELDGDYM